MSETNLWKRMRRGVAPFSFVQRIENLVGEGVPDVILHVRDDGRCLLVELKHRQLYPVRASTPIFTGNCGLRPEQVAWIYSRAIVGAGIYILGQCDDRVWLVHGRFARELHTFSRAALDECCEWKDSARLTDWERMILSMI